MSWQRIAGTLALCAAVAGVLGYLRFDAVNIALAVAAAAAAASLVGHRDRGVELGWPALSDEDRGGHRHEVSQISWSLTGRDGRVAEHGLRQLRAVAAGRLWSVGIDPDDDVAVRTALGERAWRTLRARPTDAPTVRALDACLTALEDLEGAARES